MRVRLGAPSALLAVVVASSYAGVAVAQTPGEVARKAFASTVLIVLEDATGQPTSLGSGFFVTGNQVATNLHVIEGASRGYAKIIGEPKKYNIDGVTAADPKRDLAMLKLDGAVGKALALTDSDAAQVGDTVYAVGNPQGLEGTFSQGIISSLRQIGADKLLQITAPISPGSSGGPVLNIRGEVIGVSVATYKGGQNLNFAVPANFLKALVATTAMPRALSTVKSSKGSPSLNPELGSRGSDGVVCERLTWESPYHVVGGPYAISVRNLLREDVRNVYCLVIFRDQSGKPIDVDAIRYAGVIPAGLAKRVAGTVDGTVQALTTPEGSTQPRTRIDFREVAPEI